MYKANINTITRNINESPIIMENITTLLSRPDRTNRQKILSVSGYRLNISKSPKFILKFPQGNGRRRWDFGN